MSKLAIVQMPPVFLDRAKTLERAVGQIEEAAAQGAELVVFPEAFIPGYPAWAWRLRPGADWGACEALHGRLLDQAVDLKRGDLEPLCAAARQHQVTVLCGINERDSDFSRATLFNSYLVVGPEGTVLNRHRKVMPTNPERMVWGFGDAAGLNVVDTPCGRVGALLCWENYMPLARYALYAQGMELYVAPTYDSDDDWIGSLRHIAREAGCWVVGSGTLLRGEDLRVDVADLAALYPDPEEWVNPGDSVVIAPGGEVVAGPLRREAGILYAEVDAAKVGLARRTLDVAGHYARPDLFQLKVNRQPQCPVDFS
ncbi:carbon-nitrogen hydrolase family protein [Sedimenticola hydrogenitrophicus]|uniref:carbon-nitrogen hydrolase family protein n=1 Tax=Sedimenticola hydrogenitrophicus TaxID=2967975 RepID=UPI0023AF6BC6|nr:carbon-nitrogen hydrolase family protein [Sedimenticola hydrogenitrophicus]